MAAIRSQTWHSEALRELEPHWHPTGFTVPNPQRYAHLWLWDSCFHALVWAAAGRPDRALRELSSALGAETESGFVPHIRYVDEDPDYVFWGRRWTSAITQPPMYGHALAELIRSGVSVPEGLVRRARQGFEFLLAERRRLDGLVTVVHPWETGADDSPRWDHWWGPDAVSQDRWEVKGDLVRGIEWAGDGSPIGSKVMTLAPANFNALVAFNALELADVVDDPELEGAGRELVAALDDRWDASSGTWVDAGDAASDTGGVRTLDGLLPLLVTASSGAANDVVAELIDPSAFLGAFGLTGVHRGEPVFDPDGYWRGSSWPQLNYLMWCGLRRWNEVDAADLLREVTLRGVARSGYAEHWNPDTGRGLGASPQAWAWIAHLTD